jgi:flagellar protein FlbT
MASSSDVRRHEEMAQAHSMPGFGGAGVRAERDGALSNLVLELRQGDEMIINGAPIRFRTKSRIELTAKARFLFGKQIMLLEQADSPARRIYFALQTAYIGTDGERSEGLTSARHLIAAFKDATTSALARDMLDRAIACADADEGYQALKLARRIVRHEDSVLGRTAPHPSARRPEASPEPPSEGCPEASPAPARDAGRTATLRLPFRRAAAKPAETEAHAPSALSA